MIEKPNYSNRLDRLIVALGCCRSDKGEVGSWKQLKSVVFALQEQYRVFDYDRNLWLWGPESNQYGIDFNSLLLKPGPIINNLGILSGYLFFSERRKEMEPIHHMYTASMGFLGPFIESLERFSEDKIPKETKINFIVDSIIRTRYIPPEITINEGLSIEDKAFWDTSQYPKLEKELQEWPLPTKYDLKTEYWTEPLFLLDESLVEKMKKVYEAMGIVLEEREKSHYIVRVPANLANRYNYLNPSDDRNMSNLKSAEFDLKELNASILLYLKMNDLIDGIEEFSQKLEKRLDEIKSRMRIDRLYESYLDEKRICEETYKASEEADLIMTFKDDRAIFEITNELKDTLRERSKIKYLRDPLYHPTAYLYYYHALQPIELGMMLNKHGLKYVKEQMTGEI